MEVDRAEWVKFEDKRRDKMGEKAKQGGAYNI